MARRLRLQPKQLLRKSETPAEPEVSAPANHRGSGNLMVIPPIWSGWLLRFQHVGPTRFSLWYQPDVFPVGWFRNGFVSQAGSIFGHNCPYVSPFSEIVTSENFSFGLWFYPHPQLHWPGQGCIRSICIADGHQSIFIWIYIPVLFGFRKMLGLP